LESSARTGADIQQGRHPYQTDAFPKNAALSTVGIAAAEDEKLKRFFMLQSITSNREENQLSLQLRYYSD
jgi:hypothetical protein